MLADLGSKIENKTARLAVIGLGYVGLPVACEFARAGFDVLGVELLAGRAAAINAGVCPIEGIEPGLAELVAETAASGRLHATTDYSALRQRDVVLICVETPVDDHHKPHYGALRSALVDLARQLQPGMLVIIESTVSPGTLHGLVKPVLEEGSGLACSRDFFLGNCPERVMPGRLLANIRGVSRVVGGMTSETAVVMTALYRHIVQAELDPTDCVTAELVKTVENAYRDVQIAFANEVALICEQSGGDVWKVRELVNKSPGRQMHLPGAGVGGHCIPKDPWLLAHAVHKTGLPLRLVPAARWVNTSMPGHMADLLSSELGRAGREIRGSRILLLGYAYLENSDDVRNSPSQALAESLQVDGAQVRIHDPYVPGCQGDVFQMAEGCDAVALMVRHQPYFGLDLGELAQALRTKILVDGRAVFDPAVARAAGFSYRRIGLDPRAG